MYDPTRSPEQRPTAATRRGEAPAHGAGPRPARGKANKKVANGLVALSSAAIVAVYAAGYARTAPAAADVTSAEPATAPILAASAPPTTVAPLTPTPTRIPATATATATTPAPSPASRAAAPAATATLAPPSAPPTRTAAPPTATAPSPSRAGQAGAALRDGTYTGTGASRHGSIQATVVIRGGKVVSAEITGCGTRYPCAKIAALPGQVVARQSAGVDTISGATDSSVAYRAAVSAALAQAR